MSSTKDTLKKLASDIRANPDDSFSKFVLALEFLKQDELKRARLLFEHIYQHDPEYLGVYYHLGKLYERLHQMGDAKKMYEEGIPLAVKQKEHRTLKELKEALAQLNLEMEND